MILATVLAVAVAQTSPVLTLDEAFRQAEEQNLDLQVARARLDQARTISAKAWSGYLPQLTAGGNYTYNSNEAKITMPAGYLIRDVMQPQGPAFDPSREPGIDNPPGLQTSLIMVPAELVELEIQKKHQLGGQVQLTQALIAPPLWSAIRSASLGEKVAELSVENARREILFGTAQLYYAAEGLREAVEVQERLLTVTREHERDAQVRFEVGTVTKVALLRAQIERARAEQDLQRTRNAYQSTKIALGTLLNRAPDFEVTRPPDAPAPPAPESLLEAAGERPDVLAAGEQLSLAETQRTGVFYKYAPTLAAIGRYQVSNTRGFTGDYGTWTVGAALNWTLWDGGLREAELREASAKVVESRAARTAAHNRARDEVQRGLLELESTRANLVKAEEQIKLARESASLVKSSFEAGASTYLEVVDANAALVQAELNLISEQLNAQLAALKVARAAGLFDPTSPPEQ